MITNHKPIVRGTDDGIWRRLRLLPFTQRFWDPEKGEAGPPELKADKQLPRKLRAELPGIVRWLIDACLEYQRCGLGQPEEVTTATSSYRQAMDVMATFFEDCCLRGTEFKARKSDLYNSYVKWCEEHHEKPKGSRGFGEAMTEAHFERFTSNGTWYRGIAIRE